MKFVVYKDEQDFIRRSLVKDADNESDAPFGVPAGPPDVRQLDWDSILRRLNNTLAENGAFTWDDVNRSQVGLEAAFNILKREILALYRQEYQEMKQTSNLGG